MTEATARSYRLYIDGKWVDGKETLAVVDKFTGETIGRVPVASKEMTDRAIGAAHAAFPSYSRLPAHRRFRILEKAAQLLDRHKEEIATIICREAGKAWKYSLGEVLRAVETFQFSAEEAKRIHGETVPMDASTAGEGRVGFYLRCPIGVVTAITPFNFPLNLVAHKVGPAL
ncbi:MAG TPA: aldehyde dehydrogenase family protein, partial [Candidatus Deferrimicrobiaceae bacterium]